MPTSSQNTNTIAALPAIDQPQHAEAEQREILEEAAVAAAAAHRPAVAKRRQRVDHVGQLAVHVAERIDVDARGHQRDHAEHGQRQRVDVVADRQPQRAELAQRVPIAGDRLRLPAACSPWPRPQRMVRQPQAQGRQRQDARRHDGRRGHVGGVAPARPIRGPNNTISTNEASGSSQARASSSGSEEFMSMRVSMSSESRGQWLCCNQCSHRPYHLTTRPSGST